MTTPTRVVAVGASAGGVEALTSLMAALPPDLPYAVLVVLHVPPGVPSALARILDRAGPLPVVTAVDGMPLQPGRVMVGPPDHHLLAHRGRILVRHGPTENRHRPSINALFRSVALESGPRGVGIILSGGLDDGVAGLVAIVRRGGIAIVQDPDDAVFSGMPGHALERLTPDHVAPSAEMGTLLMDIADRPEPTDPLAPDAALEAENRIAMGPSLVLSSDARSLGPPSGYTCPDCHGALMEVDSHNFRCRVGHAWSAEALLEMRTAEIESAIGVAVRSLEEKAELAASLAARVGEGMLGDRYRRSAAEAERAAEVLRRHLTEMPDAD